MTQARTTEKAFDSSVLMEDAALLLDAVSAAGKTALLYFGKTPVTELKADGTQVSEADIAVDETLKTRLLTARPDYGWLSEETDDDRRRLSCRRVWIVDPIDGTRAFLKEKPEWTISAALVDAGRPVAAAVYNPVTDELYHATRGGGASLNAAPVFVADPVELEGARLAVSQGSLRRRIWAGPWPEVEHCWVNSVAYRLALVAAGKCDGTFSLSKKSDWDIAAAHLLVEEAGGIVSTPAGGGIEYNAKRPIHPGIVAAGPALHAALVARTAKATP